MLVLVLLRLLMRRHRLLLLLLLLPLGRSWSVRRDIYKLHCSCQLSLF